MYDDVNHDGNIDANDVVYLGNANPLFTGGFGQTMRYKTGRLITSSISVTVTQLLTVLK